MKAVWVLLVGLGLAVQAIAAGDCPAPWHQAPGVSGCAKTPVSLGWHFGLSPTLPFVGVGPTTGSIRHGYLPENPGVPFRGNIVYLEGLGDSMLNHRPFFSSLTQAGFRIIAFDYLGQGGSSGNMNDTRIADIVRLARVFWTLHAHEVNRFPRPILVGWSTGGLAAYLAASQGWPDRVVLIAPGIAPRMLVGEKIHLGWPDEITLRTLTRAQYGPDYPDPHVEPIRPRSPLMVPQFAADLQMTARNLRKESVRIDPRIQGLVLLSSREDTYVDPGKTREAVMRSTSSFIVLPLYPHALHEIDNEVPATAAKFRSDVLGFLTN